MTSRLERSSDQCALRLRTLDADATALVTRGLGRLHALTADLRRDPVSTRKLRSFWTRVALERLEAGSGGVYSYNVFGISNADLARLRELHASYFQQMRAIITISRPRA